MCDKKLSADVPAEMVPLFEQAQGRVEDYFSTAASDSTTGRYLLGGERHLVLRADALGIEFFNALKAVYKDTDKAMQTARALLFDIGHSIGSADVKKVTSEIGLVDPMEKLALGPIYFAHSGLGRVHLLDGCNPSADDDFLLKFRHANAIEADALLNNGAEQDCPICMLASGYSSGWCSESFGVKFVTVEVTCQAAGDEHCEFVMAPAHRIHEHVEEFKQKHKLYIPELFGHVEREQKMSEMVYRDSLTGAYNRAYLDDFLNKNTATPDQDCKPFAYIHIDLDHFKEINDTFGHDAGDFLLSSISNRIKNLLTGEQFVARTGGDEFVVILSDFGSAASLQEKLKLLQNELFQTIQYEGMAMRASASIGVAIFPDDSDQKEELIINADMALYDVKRNGRGSYQFFEPAMRYNRDLRKKLESELHDAIDNEHLEPFFQPQVDVSARKIKGVECLMRWKHETKGFVSPAEFLPVAVNTGEMIRLGRQIMDRAIEHAAFWHKSGIEFGRLGLNASEQELRADDFVSWLLETCERRDLPTEKVSVELLETVLVDGPIGDLHNKLRALKNEGVQIELDDFGTGYASLKQLKLEIVDRVKIDRCFIQDIHRNHQNAIIVRSITDLAGSLGIEVIAEGAEVFDEIHALTELGCTVIQGYGVVRPLPARDVFDWLRAHSIGGQNQEAMQIVAS